MLPVRDNNAQPSAASSRMSTVTSVNESRQALVAKRPYEDLMDAVRKHPPCTW